MKFDVRNRWTRAVQFTAEIECSEDASASVKLGLAVKWGIANGASLNGANLDGANLIGASLNGANLIGASLNGASLNGANLNGASLNGASLNGANLIDARGIAPSRVQPLLFLLDQPGKIRAYKLVTKECRGIFYPSIEYQVQCEVSVEDASTDNNVECAQGISVATLDWCLANWRPTYKILVVEFEAKDIAAIPTTGSGKFRLHRCTVICEKKLDYKALGLVTD
jgi:hypothetical protein